MTLTLGNTPARRFAVVFAVLFLLSGVGLAAKVIIAGPTVFPDIDANGIIDLINTGPATIEAKINTKNGKFRLTGSGQVENLSGAKQKYKNDPTLNAELVGGGILSVKKSLYKVSAEGSANLKLSGEFDLELLP